MKIWAWLSFTACGMVFLLSGCGGGSVPPMPASRLAGNWLIVGPMPTDELQFSLVPEGFRLAMTFDVVGNNVVASGYANASCQPTPAPIVGESSVSTPISTTGNAAADGSFSVQTPANFPVASISIQGKAPRTNDGEWPGRYTVSLSPSFGPPCTGSFSGTFTAIPFPLIDGVYVGTGLNGISRTLVTVQVTLKQGGIVVDQVTGKSFSSNIALAGSIRVQGSSCFTSGTMNSLPQSGVEGNLVVASFSMDDGSTLSLVGSLTDITEGHIATNVVLIAGGNCGGLTNAIQLSGLDRQN